MAATAVSRLALATTMRVASGAPRLLRTVHLTSGQLRDPTLGPSENPCTFSLAMRLEDEPVAIRVGFGNDIALDFPIQAVAARISSSYGDGVTPTGAAPWTSLTPGGGVLARGNGGGPRIPRLTWTDWTPIASTPPDDRSGRPILFLRASFPGWTSPRCCETADDFAGSAEARGRDMIARIHLGHDLATNPGQSTFGFGRWSATPFYCVQYLGKRAGATVLWGGDSHFAGDTTKASIDAFPLQSCLELSTPERPVVAANYAWGGTNSGVFMPILEEMFTVSKPQFLVLQGWTSNDGPTAAANQAYYAKLVALAARAREAGAFTFLVTRFSRDTLFRNPQELAVADSLRHQELALGDPGLAVIDATPVLDDPAKPGAYRSGLSDDGIHPNTAGHAAVAALLTPRLEDQLQRLR